MAYERPQHGRQFAVARFGAGHFASCELVGNYDEQSTLCAMGLRHGHGTGDVVHFVLSYLQSAGDIYVDDIKLVAGSVPEAGVNALANSDFEAPFPGTAWNVSANLGGSTASTVTKHSGNSSLHILSTSAGSTQGSSIWQTTPSPLVTNATYTLSYWYLQSTNGGPFTARLSGSGINSTVSPNPGNTSLSAASPGAANTLAAALLPFPNLWLNELQAANVTGPVDNFGEHEPWVEIFNPGANPINLGGYYLSDSYVDPGKWAFPSNAVIGAGSFMTVWCDNQPNQSAAGNLHANFRLNAGNGTVALSRMLTNGVQLFDYLTYTNLPSNYSYGDIPDAQPFFRGVMFSATPGVTNNSSLPPISVSINEWMAENTGYIVDPTTGKFEDWFEL